MAKFFLLAALLLNLSLLSGCAAPHQVGVYGEDGRPADWREFAMDILGGAVFGNSDEGNTHSGHR